MGERTGSRVFQWVWSYVTAAQQNVSIFPIEQGYNPAKEGREGSNSARVIIFSLERHHASSQVLINGLLTR
ncbi:hypothetical protein CLIM01_08496 [Colletotrichum limetticola]|uniref:Uncharacterized protein n=1 Tax=Colletotrichum limetticola TaxID=1209924 RepID=A0ABQ9PRK5_9PEZI|nr:hypothetical protein CLIM01_08496 [Colletotrichum limetticola]